MRGVTRAEGVGILRAILPQILRVMWRFLFQVKATVVHPTREAISCLASHHFYTDQPEIALRFYRRLLQMGVNNTELWNNLGEAECFFKKKYALHQASASSWIQMPKL